MIVKIKSWDKMEKEYGLNRRGDIDTYHSFTKDIEKELPKDRIIEVEEDYRYNTYIWHREDAFYDRYISKDMIEKVITIDNNPEYFI